MALRAGRVGVDPNIVDDHGRLRLGESLTTDDYSQLDVSIPLPEIPLDAGEYSLIVTVTSSGYELSWAEIPEDTSTD